MLMQTCSKALFDPKQYKPLLVVRRWLCQVVERGDVCRGEGGCQAVVGGAMVAVAKLLSREVFVGAKVVAKPLLVG